MDDDLRELERAVSAGGDASSRIRLARALERAGRKDEVASVLRPAVANAEVRRMLLGLPSWTHMGGNAGNTRVLDVAPVRSEPRVEVLREGKQEFVVRLFVTEFTLVLEQTRPSLRVTVIDAVQGQERFEVPVEFPVFLEEGRLVSSWEEARDLWTGERVLRGDLPAVARFRGSVFASETWLLAVTHDELVAFDRQGAELWRAPSAEREVLMIDEHGFLAQSSEDYEEGAVDCFDRQGEFLWQHKDEHAQAVALGPTWVLAWVALRRRERTLAVLDRATGERRVTFSAPLVRIPASVSVACARDVVYFAVADEASIVAVDLRGDELWRVSLDESRSTQPRTIAALAPGSGCLYAVERSGTLYRLS